VQIEVKGLRVNCVMIKKVYKMITMVAGITIVVIISYYANFPIDLKSLAIYLKTKVHAA
jgi:hypothetical protein